MNKFEIHQGQAVTQLFHIYCYILLLFPLLRIRRCGESDVMELRASKTNYFPRNFVEIIDTVSDAVATSRCPACAVDGGSSRRC